MAVNLANLNKLFQNVRDQFHANIYTHYWQTDPYAGLIKKGLYNNQEGLAPTVVNLRHELPTDYPSDMTDLALSDPIGTGPSGSGCDVASTTVRFGQDNRTYNLKQLSWESLPICLTDLDFTWKAKEAIRNMEMGLMQYALRRNADWARYFNTGMIDTKIVLTGSNSFVEDENSDFDFDGILLERQNTAQAGAGSTITLDAGASAVDDFYNGRQIHIISGTGAGQSNTIIDYVGSTKVATVSTWTTNPDNTSVFRILTANLPAVAPEWTHLEELYYGLERLGANQFAVGSADGQKVHSVSLGFETKTALFKNDADVREDIRYAMPSENFKIRGINRAVNGWISNPDPFPIRYNAAGQAIYPHINTSASYGFKAVKNPDYAPVSKGGKAVYEKMDILTTETYACHVRPKSIINYGKAGFNPRNYTGEITWINNPDNNDNKLGDKGFYHVDWQLAAKPIRPEMGYTVLFKIASEVA